MNSLNTPEEKLAALCIKYADLMEENTKLKVKKKLSFYFIPIVKLFISLTGSN